MFASIPITQSADRDEKEPTEQLTMFDSRVIGRMEKEGEKKSKRCKKIVILTALETQIHNFKMTNSKLDKYL